MMSRWDSRFYGTIGLSILLMVAAICLCYLCLSYWRGQLLVGGDFEEVLSKTLSVGVERAYFEGQKDALQGDIRIDSTDSGWAWTESPWDSKKEPLWHPDKPFMALLDSLVSREKKW
ncbi:MAG: hypothetical protein GF334_10990 [Candidatus Altiarchaeales archaeon]|nr:hypothetical protein [Candidatus Altiarchaeales archaeon]